MTTVASQITSLTVVYSIVYSDPDQRKHQSSASLAIVRGIHRSLVDSLHKGPVTRKMFPFDDVIMVDQATSHYLNQWCPSSLTHIYAHFNYFIHCIVVACHIWNIFEAITFSRGVKATSIRNAVYLLMSAACGHALFTSCFVRIPFNFLLHPCLRGPVMSP